MSAAPQVSEAKRSPRFPGTLIACAVCGLILMLLKSQPDIGMLAVITVVFLAQLAIGALGVMVITGDNTRQTLSSRALSVITVPCNVRPLNASVCTPPMRA